MLLAVACPIKSTFLALWIKKYSKFVGDDLQLCPLQMLFNCGLIIFFFYGCGNNGFGQMVWLVLMWDIYAFYESEALNWFWYVHRLLFLLSISVVVGNSLYSSRLFLALFLHRIPMNLGEHPLFHVGLLIINWWSSHTSVVWINVSISSLPSLLHR